MTFIEDSSGRQDLERGPKHSARAGGRDRHENRNAEEGAGRNRQTARADVERGAEMVFTGHMSCMAEEGEGAAGDGRQAPRPEAVKQ